MKKNAKGHYEWPDDAKEELRELRGKGLTYNQIGKLWGVSPHAISGMGNRMGLPLVLLRLHRDNATRKLDPNKVPDNVEGALAVEAARLRTAVREGPANQPRPQYVCDEPPVIPYDGIEMPPLDGCCSVEQTPKGWQQCGRPVLSRRNPFCADHAARFYVDKAAGRARTESAGAS